MTLLRLAFLLLSSFFSSLLSAAVLPYGSELEVRLLNKVSSRGSHLGDSVEAALITPLFDKSRLLLPAGVVVSGTITHIDRLGLGLRHTVARLDLHFTQLHLADGTSVAMDARVSSVETARESVRPDGAILGINPTANFSTGVSAMFTLFYLGEPEFRLPFIGFKLLAARSPDAEIAFPSGTEVILRLTSSLELRLPGDRESDVQLLNSPQISSVQTILDSVPAQQTNREGSRPSDLVNILLLGSQDEIRRSFRSAGWSMPESHGIMALYHMFHCAVERKSYSMLPMSELKLNGFRPDMSFEKSLNTFSKRHHIRLWRDAQSGAWLGAATEDVRYKFSRAHLTHASDPHIDNERAKVVNDLAFTGCIDRGALIPRASFRSGNQPGSSILTDGDIAVLQLNDCMTARLTPVDPQKPRPIRIIRAAIAVGVDIARSNPVSVIYAMTKSLVDASKTRTEERTEMARAFTRSSAIGSVTSTNSVNTLARR